jgi:hypothetical protein
MTTMSFTNSATLLARASMLFARAKSFMTTHKAAFNEAISIAQEANVLLRAALNMTSNAATRGPIVVDDQTMTLMPVRRRGTPQ